MTYNGWKNYETWNVALWINNDYGLYQTAVDFMRSYRGRKPYKDFIRYSRSEGFLGRTGRTKDGALWLDDNLDYRALNAMMYELREE